MAEHETAVRSFVAVCERVAPGDWQRSPAPMKWSPAAVMLHVCRAYELGRDAVNGGKSMRLQVSRSSAWFSRTLVLPVILATNRFPRGAAAPVEVVPDAAEARLLMQDESTARLQHVAGQAASALREASRDRPSLRLTHAYFGPLSPHGTLRLLSAHTRHHARGLAYSTGIAPAS